MSGMMVSSSMPPRTFFKPEYGIMMTTREDIHRTDSASFADGCLYVIF